MDFLYFSDSVPPSAAPRFFFLRDIWGLFFAQVSIGLFALRDDSLFTKEYPLESLSATNMGFRCPVTS